MIEDENLIDFIHVWAGRFEEKKTEFDELFRISPGVDDVLCEFSLFVGHVHKEDIFGRLFSNGEGIDLYDAPAKPKELELAISNCGEDAVNALVYYSCADLPTPPKGSFHGLGYLGRFLFDD